MVTVEQLAIFRSDLLFLFNNLNIFLMNSNSFNQVQVRVRKKYFFEFMLEFGKMIKFIQVRSPEGVHACPPTPEKKLTDLQVLQKWV